MDKGKLIHNCLFFLQFFDFFSFLFQDIEDYDDVLSTRKVFVNTFKKICAEETELGNELQRIISKPAYLTANEKGRTITIKDELNQLRIYKLFNKGVLDSLKRQEVFLSSKIISVKK